jgi:RHS repeat-associated protein
VATIEGFGTSEKIYYDHTDHLSGSNVLTDKAGAVAQVLDYYPFGEVRINEQTGDFDESNKFTGHELDDDTGLYYANARYYDARIGRFVSLDPLEGDIMNPQSLNKYAYVMNNPMKYVDPSGEFAFLAFLIPAAEFVAEGIVAIAAIACVTYTPSYGQILDNTPPVVDYKIPAISADPRESLTHTGNTTPPENVGVDILETPSVNESGGFFETFPSFISEIGNTMYTTNIHGNSANYPGITWGYSLRDRDTGDVLKYGQTIDTAHRYSGKYLDSINADLNPEVSGTKKEMLQWENAKINKYKEAHDGQRPPLNKSDH